MILTISQTTDVPKMWMSILNQSNYQIDNEFNRTSESIKISTRNGVNHLNDMIYVDDHEILWNE